MTNWTALIARMTKAEKDVQEWGDGLKDAEKTLANVRGEMQAALSGKLPVSTNGTAHKASAAPVVKVRARRARHDYKRKERVVALVKARGFVTVDDVISAEKCGRGLIHDLLSELVKKQQIARISRGRYASLSLGKAA